jgi:uncharacterized membrane protein
MDWLTSLFLYLHVTGVIVAFGPTIAFPMIASHAAREPMHGNFALRVSEHITSRIVEPGAVFVFVMGVGLIISGGWNPLAELWLGLSIVLFLITFTFSLTVQLPTVKKMIALTSQLGPDGSGPPPEFVELSRRAARGGQFQTVMLFAIVALMVVKPF